MFSKISMGMTGLPTVLVYFRTRVRYILAYGMLLSRSQTIIVIRALLASRIDVSNDLKLQESLFR
jgi:hypothetical protein